MAKSKPLLCSGPDHEAFRGMLGHADQLGTTTRPDQRDGSLCLACAKAREVVLLGQEEKARQKREEMRSRILGQLGVTLEEAAELGIHIRGD